MQSRSVRAWWAAIAITVAVVAPAGVWAQSPAPGAPTSSATASDDDAPSPAWFRHAVRRTVSRGTGEYEGYQDSLVASGRYQTRRVDAERLQITADYAWRYVGSECETGEESRVVMVELPSRRYVDRTDLDDYDGHEGPLALWLWVPPDLEVGASVPLLERTFAVAGREPAEGGRALLRLQATGEGTRDDAYGSFRTRFTDTYWFDAATGYFVRSEYQELDENEQASFEWNERVTVEAASYLGGVDADPPEVAGCPAAGFETRRTHAQRNLFMVLPFAGVALLLAYLVFRRRSPAPRFVAQRMDAKSTLPTGRRGALAPFLPHLARVALRTGEPVVVVREDGSAPLGLAIGDREQRFAIVDAADGDVCEALREDLGVDELLSHTFYEELPSVGRAARAAGVAKARAYNLVETQDVLRLRPLAAQPFDATRVAALRSEHVEEAAAFLAKLQGLPARAWLEAALAEGDHGFWSRGEAGEVLGTAFVTVCGEDARLHSLLVAPDARGKGVGSELVRACVSAAAALGAATLFAEVPAGEVGARSLLESLGFAKDGELFLMTASATRAERRIVRR
jgi:GNAT superfamily N-acetyltransferase